MHKNKLNNRNDNYITILLIVVILLILGFTYIFLREGYSWAWERTLREANSIENMFISQIF